MTFKIDVFFVPYHNTGVTFVDWSLRYICAQQVANKNDEQVRNWHHHPARICQGRTALQNLIENLASSNSDTFEIVHVAPLQSAAATRLLFDIEFEKASSDQRYLARLHCLEDYRDALSWCHGQQITPVIFDFDHRDLYSIFYNNRYPLDWHSQQLDSMDCYIDRYLGAFYSDQIGFSDAVWDRRERVALSIEPFDPIPVTSLYDPCLPHLYYTTDDVWNGMDRFIEELATELHHRVDVERLASWQPIYNGWRRVHDPYFSRHLPRIIDAIVHNKYMCLRRFKLNFFMEAIIQRQLIVQHDLNLRNWQLEKFPDNTQDLHQLLEPNHHVL